MLTGPWLSIRISTRHFAESAGSRSVSPVWGRRGSLTDMQHLPVACRSARHGAGLATLPSRTGIVTEAATNLCPLSASLRSVYTRFLEFPRLREPRSFGAGRAARSRLLLLA